MKLKGKISFGNLFKINKEESTDSQLPVVFVFDLKQTF